jgi:alkylation response protein AidB-like acyl-CoA dehydrogenase
LTLFLVEGNHPGLVFTPLETLAYDKMSEITFDNVRVPKENIVGEINQAWPILEKIQDQAAVAKCADILGGLKVALKSTVDYAKQRKQFGRAIGSFQVIQHYCAEMEAEFETSMVITYQAAWKMAEEMPASLEASMAKAWISKASTRLLQLGHQIHGAIGFCEETDIHLYYRRARAGTVMYGDEDHHLEKVARGMGL